MGSTSCGLFRNLSRFVTFHEFKGEAVSGESWGQLANVEVQVNLVLLVEDDADSARTSKSILERHGMSVKIAKDGGQAQSLTVMRRIS